MAQILAFPGAFSGSTDQPVEARRDEAARSVAHHQIESATADFDRMMAHHAELQRQVAEFNRLCAEALAERPMAQVLHYPMPSTQELCHA